MAQRSSHLTSNMIYRLPTVIDMTGLSKSSIYHYMSQNAFPSQVRIGVRAVGWLDSDIQKWISNQASHHKV